MRKSRFTEQQIIGFLKQAESGLPVKDVCRQGGFSEPTFYKWRAKYGGMEADEALLDANLPLLSPHIGGDMGDVVWRHTFHGGHVTKLPVMGPHTVGHGQLEGRICMM